MSCPSLLRFSRRSPPSYFRTTPGSDDLTSVTSSLGSATCLSVRVCAVVPGPDTWGEEDDERGRWGWRLCHSGSPEE